jgi:methylenetetrahydromethanopterin dehydrogenase
MDKKIKVGILKAGCVGSLPLIEFLLDERAEREDLQVRVVGSGAKVTPEECIEGTRQILEQNVDLIIFVGPAQTTSGPSEARNLLKNSGKPTIIISDSPAKRIVKNLEEDGFGYIIVMGDPLIGARREFLDPTEMAIFNSNIIKVLAITGIYKIMLQEIDRVIHELKRDLTPRLPKLILDSDEIMERSDFKNPYARAKAMAAYELTKKVAEINIRACFIEKEREKYIPLVACTHEIAQAAAKLAEEAREIEKYSDTLIRRPHSKEGRLGIKEKLMEKPIFD